MAKELGKVESPSLEVSKRRRWAGRIEDWCSGLDQTILGVPSSPVIPGGRQAAGFPCRPMVRRSSSSCQCEPCPDKLHIIPISIPSQPDQQTPSIRKI